MKPGALFNILLVVLLLVGAVGIVYFTTNSNNNSEVPVSMTREGLVINEVMAKNQSAVPDNNGRYSDWVELYNGSTMAVSLNGLSLTDKESEPNRYPLPNITMEPDSYLIIWCSGDTTAVAPYHAGFKLSAGETVYIFDGNTEIVDSVYLDNPTTNHSFARQTGGGFIETEKISPGYPNTEEGHQAFISQYEDLGSSALRLNEIMSANKTTIADMDGDYPDWIELINTGSTPINLEGYSLSDDPSEPRQWIFSSGTVAPGEVFLAFASGKDLKEETPPHTSFKLSASGETVILYNPDGMIIDKVVVPELKDDESYALINGQWEKTIESTPGLHNTDEGRQEVARRIISANAGLYISEVVSSNGGSFTIGDQTPDWVEITNKTGQTVNLMDYGLSDRTGRPHRWQFTQETLLGDGERIVVCLDGLNTYESDAYHASFKLAMEGGDWIVLSDPQGNILDKIAMPALRQDISIGRDEERTGLFYYAKPQPGTAKTNGKSRIAPKPVISTPGGIVDAGMQATVNSIPGYTLRYTTDATEPTASSPELTGPLTINQTTILRVAAFAEDAIAGFSTSATYLVGVNHTVPVVALVTDPDNLFSHENGIFADGPGYQEAFPHGSNGRGANYWLGWEKPVHVELFNAGDLTLSQNGGLKVNGQYSRTLPQKSITIYARKEYDEKNTFDAPLFENRDYTQYKAFTLRSTGQDNNRSRMRDAMLTSLAEGTGVMYQDTKTAVVYINGEFWGHYNLRERINKNSVAQWEGIPLDDRDTIENIDLIKGNSRALNGTNKGYREIIDFVKANSLTNAENLKWVTDRVDVENYLSYQAMEMIIGNSDNGNIKFYNTNTPGSKWKWILYDLDWSFNTSESVGVSWNTFTAYLDPRGTGVGDAFENILFRRLLEVPEMRDLFLERFAYHLNNTFSPQAVNARIDEFAATMEPEMELHFSRWPNDGSLASWQRHIERLRTYANERPAYMKKYCKEYFGLSDSKMTALFGE